MEIFLKKIIILKPTLIGLGEMEHGTHSKLIGEILKNANSIKGIFLEDPVDYQLSVNKYLKIGSFDESLNQLIAGAAKEGKSVKETLVAVLNIARKKRIPVICIDSSKKKSKIYSRASKYGSYFLRGKSRDEDMYTTVTNALAKKPGTWIAIAHAAHLDFSFHMHENDPSLGMRLKKRLQDKFFNICMLKIKKVRKTKYYFADEPLNVKLEKLLKDNDYHFLIKKNKIKGFQTLIVHS